MNKKIVNIVSFVGGGLLLCVYPFMMMANIMSLGGVRTGNEKVLQLIVANGFLIFSSIYPITYLTCLLLYFFKKGLRNSWISIVPLIHILIVVLLFFIWSLV